MRLLGAVMAGGRSSRFGADKSAAIWKGQPLIAHSVSVLAGQVDGLVICGPLQGGLVCLDDIPGPGLGPLAAINAALHYAVANEYAVVISVPVDVHPLPSQLRDLLGGDGPAVLERQTAIGWWPADLSNRLDAHIASGGRSIASWISATACRRIDDAGLGLFNINRPGDLDKLDEHAPAHADSGSTPA